MCCHAELDKLKNQVFLRPLFLFLSHTFQTHMRKRPESCLKNKYKNIALPKCYIQSDIYVGIYAFFYLEKSWRENMY